MPLTGARHQLANAGVNLPDRTALGKGHRSYDEPTR